MPWGTFFTIVAQVLIGAIVLAILIAIAMVIYNDIKKDDK